LVTGRESAEAPEGQRFLPLPPRRPRVLVPLEAPRAAAGTLVANLAMRRPRDRAVRRGLSLLVRTGVAARVWQRHLVAVEQAATSGPTLLGSLQDNWRRDVHALGFTVRPLTPNHKPTFVAVDSAGRVLGYGKIASTPGTISRLRREADGLRWMSGQTIPGLRAPELLASFRWGASAVAVVSPLPQRSARFPSDDRAPGVMLMDALERDDTERAGTMAGRLAARVRRIDDRQLSEAAAEFEGRFDDRYGDLDLPVGRIHGDWVPWNMAVDGSDTWVFDWEHSEARSALPLDIVHWHLLVARDRYGLPLDQAVTRADDRAGRDLARLGFDRPSREAILSLGRLHLAARAAELFHDSGLWVRDERRVVLDQLERGA
jgi:hypothetical protein